MKNHILLLLLIGFILIFVGCTPEDSGEESNPPVREAEEEQNDEPDVIVENASVEDYSDSYLIQGMIIYNGKESAAEVKLSMDLQNDQGESVGTISATATGMNACVSYANPLRQHYVGTFAANVEKSEIKDFSGAIEDVLFEVEEIVPYKGSNRERENQAYIDSLFTGSDLLNRFEMQEVRTDTGSEDLGLSIKGDYINRSEETVQTVVAMVYYYDEEDRIINEDIAFIQKMSGSSDSPAIEPGDSASFTVYPQEAMIPYWSEKVHIELIGYEK